MAEGKRSFGCLQLTVIGLLISALLCCCGGGGLVLLGPEWLVGLVMQDAPMRFDAPPRDPDAGARFEADLADDGIVRMTGEEATAWVWSHDPDHLIGCEIGIDDDVSLRLSMQPNDLEEQYLNLRFAGTFELERGWFTHAGISEFTIGDLVLGTYMDGQELAADFNRSLADNRAQDAEFDARMDAVERIHVEGDTLVVEIDLDAWPDPLPAADTAPAEEAEAPAEDVDPADQAGGE